MVASMELAGRPLSSSLPPDPAGWPSGSIADSPSRALAVKEYITRYSAPPVAQAGRL